MLYEEIDDPESVTPADLREGYVDELAVAVEAVGVDEVVATTNLDRDLIEAVLAGETPDMNLSDAAAILACQPDAPDQESILLEVRDHLLMGMSIAVMDVEVLAGELNDVLSAKKLQQKIEGRAPMTLDEYATIHHAIARGRS